MWTGLWYSLGRATKYATSFAGGRTGSGESSGRALRETIQADCASALLGLAAARLCGVASAAFRRRAIVFYSVMHISVKALVQMMLGRGAYSVSVKAAKEQAGKIAGILRERLVVPNRIGIDGLPGSGKSTLARALAQELDMKWASLDYKNLHRPGNLGQERTVYEHHRLLRTQDVDIFEVIVYIDEPVDLCRARVRRRGRGLILAAVLDYDRLKEVGKLAFDVCGGEALPIPGSNLVLKTRPPGGYKAEDKLARTLNAAGFDTSGMGKEEMLFLLACGKRRSGLKAYLRPLAYIARMGDLVARLRSAGRRFVAVLLHG